jgi:outer membrane protein insertion porin family
VTALVALLTGAPARAQPPPAAPAIVVKDVAVEGARRVQEAVILGRIKTSVGSAFSPTLLSEDLRSVFGLGFFDDVQVKVEDFEGGVKVTFVVTERPFVRDVQFVGNKTTSATDLQEKIDLKLGSVYNPVDVQRAKEKLTEYYEDEGYYEVQITPTTEKFSDGDVKVVFNVDEGRRMTIDQVVIVGNKGLSAKAIKAVLATQERQYFILRGTVQRQKVEEDVERILALYNDNGFIQARVESHEITVDREKARVTVTFRVAEGPQYRVGEIIFTGATLLPEAELRRQLTVKTGDVFSRTQLRESQRRLTDLYSTIGRASAEINPRTEQTSDYRININFEINEGPEVYVERINITGNTRSEDKILRRELPMVEGDLFTLQKLQRARQRLVNLGYFEKVDVTTSPGADRNKIIVNIDVTERPTGLFSIGGGYSSADGLVGTIDLSQRNFLGRGYEATLRLRIGGQTQQGVLSFTDPWFLDTPLSAGIDLFANRRVYDQYTYATIGGGPRLSHPFLEYWRWFASYRLTQDTVSDITSAEAASLLADQAGTTITSLISGSLVRDSRDNVIAPTKGSQFSLLAEFAGLGGDNRFVKTISFLTYFQPIWFGHILAGRVEGGYAVGWGGKEVPVFERFYLGGPNSIRAFKFRTISPVDSTGTLVGGTVEVLASVEYIIPLPYNFRLAAFFDIGNSYGPPGTPTFDITNLKYGPGAGIRWLSPFGPIRVDYGLNIEHKSNGQPFGAFQFSVGSPF